MGTFVPTQKLEVAAGNIKVESGYGLGASFSATSMAAYYPYLTNMNAKAGLGPVLGYDEASFLVSDQVIAFGETDGDTVEFQSRELASEKNRSDELERRLKALEEKIK